MEFYGLQKLTLLDFPRKIACTLFTGGCNLRCPFCHNAELISARDEAQYSEEDVLTFLSSRKGILDGVCVTGGEPLLHRDLPEFLKKVKALGFAVKIDTNGCVPQRLQEILAAGLVDYVAMDLKNRFEKYPETVGIPDFDPTPVQKTMEILSQWGGEYEFRTTVVKEFHTKDDLLTVADLAKDAPHFALQSFRDSPRVLRAGLHSWDERELKNAWTEVRRILPNAELRGI